MGKKELFGLLLLLYAQRGVEKFLVSWIATKASKRQNPHGIGPSRLTLAFDAPPSVSLACLTQPRLDPVLLWPPVFWLPFLALLLLGPLFPVLLVLGRRLVGPPRHGLPLALPSFVGPPLLESPLVGSPFLWLPRR